MVERARQLGLLLQAFDGAEADRTSHLFTVLGPAGVGKSRLVAEVPRTPGRSSRHSGPVSALRRRDHVLPGAGDREGGRRSRRLRHAPDVIESKVCAVLEGDELQESVCARVSQLLGVAEVASPDETHWAIRRFLGRLRPRASSWWSSTTSTWAESVLLDLIEHIADLSRDAPLLLLCMARESCSTSGPRGPAAS